MDIYTYLFWLVYVLALGTWMMWWGGYPGSCDVVSLCGLWCLYIDTEGSHQDLRSQQWKHPCLPLLWLIESIVVPSLSVPFSDASENWLTFETVLLIDVMVCFSFLGWRGEVGKLKEKEEGPPLSKGDCSFYCSSKQVFVLTAFTNLNRSWSS